MSLHTPLFTDSPTPVFYKEVFVAKTEERLDKLENEVESIKEHFDDLKDWLSNGFTSRIGEVVASQVLDIRRAEKEEEREERKLQLEEQREKNREIGAKKDRTMKIILGISVPAVPILTAAMIKILGG